MQQSNLSSESAIHLSVAARIWHMAARQILPCIFNNMQHADNAHQQLCLIECTPSH